MVELSPDGKTLIQVKDVYKQYLICLDIPEGVCIIGKHAFEDCCSLEHISFPETIETIEIGAFRKCRSLKELSLPSSLREIQNFAFAECSSVTSKILPEGVRRLGFGIFEKVAACDAGVRHLLCGFPYGRRKGEFSHLPFPFPREPLYSARRL